MSGKGTVNYQTVQQFEDAMWLSFEAAQEEMPDEPALLAISAKRDAATTLRNAYHNACKKQVSEENTVIQTTAVEGLKKTAIQAQQDVDTAVRKWYSAQWQGKQAAKRGR